MLEKIARSAKTSALVLLTTAAVVSSGCGTNSNPFIPAVTPMERMKQACPMISNENILQALLYEVQGFQQQGLTRDQAFQVEYQSCLIGAGQGSQGVQYLCSTCMNQAATEVYGH